MREEKKRMVPRISLSCAWVRMKTASSTTGIALSLRLSPFLSLFLLLSLPLLRQINFTALLPTGVLPRVSATPRLKDQYYVFSKGRELPKRKAVIESDTVTITVLIL